MYSFPYTLLLSFIFIEGSLTNKCQREHSDIIFIIDSSTSVCECNDVTDNRCSWDRIKTFVKNVVQLLPMEESITRVALIPFSSRVHLKHLIELTNDKATFISALDRLPFVMGNTNTSGALRQARMMLSGKTKQERKKIVVLMNDGVSNVDSHLTLKEARLNKQLGIVHYAVGVGSYVDENELQDLVTDPSNYHYLYASNFENLYYLVNELLQRLSCFPPPFSEPCKDKRTDLVFLIDASGSILVESKDRTERFSNWNLIIDFVVNVVRNLDIGFNETRVSLIKFSHVSSVEFHLDSFGSHEEIIARIANTTLVGSETNISGALQQMNDQVLTAVRGDRPDVHNVAILLTDGQSNVNASGTIPEARRAKKRGVRMFVIGLTNNVLMEELERMSSKPLSTHLFSRASYSLVSTVVSNLVWNVCHDSCEEENVGDSCSRIVAKKCGIDEPLNWKLSKGHLIVGHDYARLTDISSAESCQNICLQDPLCRSIEYIPGYSECSVSYYRRADAPFSFKPDSEVSYYEWVCGAQHSTKQKDH